MTHAGPARWLLVMLLAAASLRAQAPRFQPPDGHWWLRASQDQRYAFLAGFGECYVYTLNLAYVATPTDRQWGPAITAYYRRHPAALALRVPAVIERVNQKWLRLKHAHLAHDPPSNGYSGVAWVQIGEHDLIVRGFLSCQAAAHRPGPDVPVASVVARVNALLGISKAEPWYVGKHGDDRLGPVILKAERQAAAAKPAVKPRARP